MGVECGDAESGGGRHLEPLAPFPNFPSLPVSQRLFLSPLDAKSSRPSAAFHQEVERWFDGCRIDRAAFTPPTAPS